MKCRVFLQHSDGRVEETSLWGDGPIAVGDYFRLPDSGPDWWKVASLRWGSPVGSVGVATLEPTELPPHLASRDV